MVGKKLIAGLGLLAILGFVAPKKYSGQGSIEDKVNYQTIKISTDDTTKKSELLNLDSRYNYNEKDLERFNRMVGYTIEESKEDHKNSIIINKSAYTLYLIEEGKVYSKYPIELGFNPYEDKKEEGDGCTPEGFYEVIRKRGIGQTDFYKHS